MVSLSGTSDNAVYYVYILADPAPGTVPSNRQFGGSTKKGFDPTTFGAFTGGVFLGRSGPLLVTHAPEFVVVGWDYDDDTGDDFDNTGVIQVPSDIINMVAIDANRKDNRNITLDSGAFFEKGAAFVSLNSGLTPSPTTSVDLLWLAQDDDNPSDFEMRIFLSTTGGLTVADLVGAGLDSLTNSIVVAGSDTLNIENRGISFVALERDSLTNLVTSFTPRGDYFVYYAATDGNDDHRVVSQVLNDPFIASPTASVLSVRHAPNLFVDNFSLNDFDGTGDGDLDVITGIDVSQMFIDADGKDLRLGPAQRAITISWGELGLPGDSDVDDDATIEIYFSTRSDFKDVRGSIAFTSGNSNGDDLLATISQGNSDTHKIGQTREDPDGQFDNQLTWDLWSYVSPEGTIPSTGVRYFLYARMSGGTTTRLISLTRFGVLDNTGTSMAVSIQHPPFIRPIEPARDITATMNQPVLISWQAVDVDNQEADGLAAIPANTSGRLAPNSDTASPNIRILLTSIDWGEVTAWGSITDFTAATGNVDRFWVGNSGDGSLVEEIELNEGVDSSFVLLGNRMRNNLFSTITGTAASLSTGDLALQTNAGAGETYFVYLAIDDGRDETVADAVVGGTSNTRNFGAFSPLVRAPGRITFTGIVPTNPPTTTRFIVPARMQTVMGEVVLYPIIPDVLIPNKQINVVDIFISVDADKFEAVDLDASTAGVQPSSLGDNSQITSSNVSSQQLCRQTS